LSVQTTPHGQPLPPGAQVEYPEQFAQFPLEHVQLWPPLETTVPWVYVRQLDCEYAVPHALPPPPPQTFVVPPPPHVCGDVHEPQLSVPPQPSLIEPQFFPCAEHVVGVQEDPPHAPLSVQTAPHGQPLPPGVQLEYPAQLAQLPLEQVQLWPPFETWVPVV
jgi:phage tail protein X